MERSDYSGRVLDGDTGTTATFLHDGRRYRLELTRAEAAELADKGTDKSHLGDRIKRFALAPVTRWALGAVVGAVIVALIGQYVADYYADKQQRLDLEASLLTTINRGTTSLLNDSVIVNA